MPHLNELEEQFGGKGLSIIGVTSEGAGPTEKWVAKKKAAYAYGYDKGGALKRELGVTGIPAAFLVDPSGKIVWQGHPSSLSSNLIEEHIKGATSHRGAWVQRVWWGWGVAAPTSPTSHGIVRR